MLSGKTIWREWATKSRKEDAVFFDQVFHADVVPILSQIDANDKNGRKWFWCYQLSLVLFNSYFYRSFMLYYIHVPYL